AGTRRSADTAMRFRGSGARSPKWPGRSCPKTPSSFPGEKLRPNVLRKVSGGREARGWLPDRCAEATRPLRKAQLLRIRCRALACRPHSSAADDCHRLAAEIGKADQEHGEQEEQLDGIRIDGGQRAELEERRHECPPYQRNGEQSGDRS